jgi:glycosyltransferase involved in cell wall biosynthesis
VKVSVICCTWNSATYLPESIRSVLDQDHSDIEYIFVDGGSTDETLDQIAAVPRPIKLLHDVRGGISRAMNAGIEIATGDVIAHLHSDDYYLHPRVLGTAVRALESANAGWAFGRIVRAIDGELVPESYHAPKYSPGRLLRGNFIPHPATFVRRDWMLKAGNFDESRKYAMDYDLWLKLSKMGDPVELGEPLAAFRVHGGSLSSANRIAAMEDDFNVRRAHCRRNPLTLAEHLLRYWVRKRRIQRKIQMELLSK